MLLFGEPTVALRGPVERLRPREDRPDARGPRRPLRVPPRLPGERARARLRLRAVGPPADARAPTRASTRTWRRTGAPGKLALQYWFFYAFNDFNNTHEGDWEMIQLVFDADDAADALDERAGRGRLQLARGRREGGVGRRQARDRRRHPSRRLSRRRLARQQVHRRRSTSAARPRRGSAATTRAARTASSRPTSSTIPSDPAAAAEAFPWITFEGRWGELQKAFFNGPTGPNMKTQWTDADRVVGGLARPQLRGPDRRRARDGRHRLLLLRRRDAARRR